MLEKRIAEAVAARNWGKPSADKRGRTPQRPYVPVIEESPVGGRDWREQILGKAFATRPEAVAYAAVVIEARKANTARQLAEPRYRALRESYGLPREIETKS
jgi:hypothetical protein